MDEPGKALRSIVGATPRGRPPGDEMCQGERRGKPRQVYLIILRSGLMLNVNHHSSIFTIQEASHIAFELYGLRAEARTLPGERDYNFHLKTEAGQEFVLKVAPSGE